MLGQCLNQQLHLSRASEVVEVAAVAGIAPVLFFELSLQEAEEVLANPRQMLDAWGVEVAQTSQVVVPLVASGAVGGLGGKSLMKLWVLEVWVVV